MKRKEFLKMTAGLAGGLAGLPLMPKAAGAAPAAAGLAHAAGIRGPLGPTPRACLVARPPARLGRVARRPGHRVRGGR